jgi:hypothetical protein
MCHSKFGNGIGAGLCGSRVDVKCQEGQENQAMRVDRCLVHQYPDVALRKVVRISKAAALEQTTNPRARSSSKLYLDQSD